MDENEKKETAPERAETINAKAAEEQPAQPDAEAKAEAAAESAPETEKAEEKSAAAEETDAPAAAEEKIAEAPAAAPESEAAPEKPAKKHKRKKRGRGKLIGIVLLIYLAVLAVAAVLLDGRHAVVELNGPAEMSAEFGEDFVDPGARALSDGRLFGRSKRPLALEADRKVDTRALGDTVLTYSASVLGKTVSAQRTVHVVDTTPPVITLKPAGALTSWFKGFEEPGFTAEDNVDGDLTERVVCTQLRDRVLYSVADSSGNETVAERTIQFSVSTPAISLVGGGEVTIPASMVYADPGYQAMDNLGNDLTEFVVVSGEITPYAAGSYELRYTIENEQGDAAIARRRVTVAPVERPATVMPEKPTIYLTFDDGPGPYTDALLSVLHRYGVKATFFVTDQFEGYEDCIGRAYADGHAIGVHSLTHDWSIYNSEAAYFEDFMAMEEIVREQTGSYTKLFRFPGGSSNTVSRFNPGIMSRLSQYMQDMGYVYFDWNVSSGDAGGTTSTWQVIDNVCSGCAGKQASVVLQHDIKDFSVDAVESIILWGQRNGYAFAALDETSFQAHHGINN